MNRRNFLKFLAKGAAIVGTAGVLGLPEVEAIVDKNSDTASPSLCWKYIGEDIMKEIAKVIEAGKQLPQLMPMWEYELIYDSSGYEAILIDKNLRTVKRYLLSDYLWYGADNFVNVLREDYQKYKVEELKVWADDIENYTTNHYFGGLNELISNS